MRHIKTIKAEKVFKGATPGPSNSLLKGMFKNTSIGQTANGAITYTRSGSALLDFYAQAGAMRANPTGALDLFKKALSEDKLLAIRILFYLRDIRGGQGERDLFRNCLEYIGDTYPAIFSKIIGYVPEYGRWDDLFFDNEACYQAIKTQLKVDITSDKPSLLAKWLPTINASSANTRAKAKVIAKAIDLDEVAYRRVVRGLRKMIATVEEKMSAKEWDKINYSGVPSQASRIYKDAFKKHDDSRYSKFIEKAETGEVKINAGTLYPNQIYKTVQTSYSPTLEALWNQLPDYTRGTNALVVADVSGSMMGDPLSVSVSLALYFAGRNKGQFKNHFITFSENPVLQAISGRTLIEKMNSIQSSQWMMNTNLQKVFDLILWTATQNKVSEDEMPSTLYIISDMEFDTAICGSTNFEAMRNKYEASGYKLPTVVFWNVNASGKNLPVQKNEQGVALVSGFSPVIFKMVVEDKDPEQVMMDTINAERYIKITF